MHISSMEVSFFLSRILSYFSFFDLALIPYQGKLPSRKYSITKPKHSKSSLLDYSTPRWVFRDAYLAVPVKFLLSLYSMCSLVLGSR